MAKTVHSATNEQPPIKAHIRDLFGMVTIFIFASHVFFPIVVAIDRSPNASSNSSISQIANPIAATDIPTLTALLCGAYYFVIASNSAFRISPVFKAEWEKWIITSGILLYVFAMALSGFTFWSRTLRGISTQAPLPQTLKISFLALCRGVDLELVYFLTVLAVSAVIAGTLLYIVRDSAIYKEVTIQNSRRPYETTEVTIRNLSNKKTVAAFTRKPPKGTYQPNLFIDVLIRSVLSSVSTIGCSFILIGIFPADTTYFLIPIALLTAMVFLFISYVLIYAALREAYACFTLAILAVYLIGALIYVCFSAASRHGVSIGAESLTVFLTFCLSVVLYGATYRGIYCHSRSTHFSVLSRFRQILYHSFGLLPVTFKQKAQLREARITCRRLESLLEENN